jgi:23S rRNA (uracil1939-C5)-methyltransferase
LSKHYTTGDVIDLTVEKIVPRGFGLGFAENLTVLVPLSAPGDKLRVRIRDIKKRMAFADIVEIRQPGPHRTTPACEHFGKCGGCDLQQMTYKAQLDAKSGLVRDCLTRIGKIDYDGEIPVIASPQPFGYRARARWQIDGKRNAIGYFARESKRLVPINNCPVLTPGLQSTLDYIRETMGMDETWAGARELEAATGDEGRVSMFTPDRKELSPEVTFAVNGDSYAFSAATFFQANKFLVGELIDTALGDAGGETAFDLYSGVGLFTLPMARRFEKVIAVEENRVAAGLAEKNVEVARFANVDVINRRVAKFLAGKTVKSPDFILLDPPRAGDESAVIQGIAKLKPARISYVSCEPSILARDLRILVDAGYQIDKITALDMFPQTHHVETVAHLSVAEARS